MKFYVKKSIIYVVIFMSIFKAGRFDIETGKKTYIMGILNITPDSFSDGGKFCSFGDAIKQAEQMLSDGADIIDIGAVSTRPFSKPVSEDEEWSRLKDILPVIIKSFNAPVSVDTFNPSIAEKCLSMGVDIINDVSGVFNPVMAEAVKGYNCAWITMHGGVALRKAEESVEYKNGVVEDINFYFDDFIKKAVAHGINKERIWLDAGFGFSKDIMQNIELLENFEKIKKYGLPLLCALSRKRFIGEMSGEKNPEDRDNATLEANIRAIEKGADIIRVHNVRLHNDAVR